jgi:hypothetical protein
VVSVTDPYGRILGFLDRDIYKYIYIYIYVRVCVCVCVCVRARARACLLACLLAWY